MPVPLRRRLVLLLAAGVLPLAIMAGAGLYGLWRQHIEDRNQVGLELARSVANAVDAELRSTIAALTTLATSLTLDVGDLQGFRTRAALVLSAHPEWVGVQLFDRSGTVLIDTRALEGSALPLLAERESFDRVISTRLPVVGHLTRHGQREWLFAIRAPVVRGGAITYVLTALVRPDAVREVLTRQNVPEDWLISIVDAKGQRVARSRAHETHLGGRLSDSVQQVVNRGAEEGFGTAYALEGERIFTPYSRIKSGNWMAVFGIPTAQVEKAAYQSLAAYAFGVLLSLGVGTLGAIWVARTITRPIAVLRTAAAALARKAVPQPPATGIEEIRDVGAALRIAGEELVSVEAEREELLKQERLARETAEAADRAKEEFMAVLSHELRTPLNAVYGWARMLQSGQLKDAATIDRAKDAIVRNADAQVQLIDDLLDLSRITSGKMRLDVRRVELPQVLQGAIDTVRPAADAKSIVLRAAIDPHIDPITGDPARLQQVVWNLLMNAVKFTPRGGEVMVRAHQVESSVEITVSDTGRGISPTVLPYIFDRFRQADSSSTRTFGGLGLGLALVKHLVELHGGTVTADSAGEGQGATFVVTLPVAVTALPSGLLPARPDVTHAIELPANIARLDHLCVLVVDDDGEGLALAEAILARAGADVRTCQSAPAAFQLLQQCRPDVLVSDLEMPGEDGYSLIRKVRALATASLAATPSIALSGYGRPQDRLRALAAGFNMHVPKPVDPRELTTIVAGLAGRPAAEEVR